MLLTVEVKKQLAKIAAVALAMVLLFVTIIAFYYYGNSYLAKKEYQETLQNYVLLTPDAAGFGEAHERLEKLNKLFQKYPSLFSATEIGRSKILLADSLVEIDPQRGIEILKSIARDARYPNNIRAEAINFIVNDFEFSLGRQFAKKVIFNGEDFERFLSDSEVNEEIAARKLSEWSYSLFPTMLASYRIAYWYASEIYKKPALVELEKRKYLALIEGYLRFGDDVLSRFDSATLPQFRGMAYELKARINELLGGAPDETRQLFRSALEAYAEKPQNIFQRVHSARTRLFFAAFLARHLDYPFTVTYETGQIGAVKDLLSPMREYLVAAQKQYSKNVHLVNFLITANSVAEAYYSVDFSKKDFNLIKKIYPEFGSVVDSLDLSKYAQGHPLEVKLAEWR